MLSFVNLNASRRSLRDFIDAPQHLFGETAAEEHFSDRKRYTCSDFVERLGCKAAKTSTKLLTN